MVASTPASVASSATHHAPFSQGKFHSFHFHFELFEICSYFAVFHVFRGFAPLFCYEKIWAAMLMAGPSWFRFRLVQRRLLRVSNHISFT
jgi:hypothetical protein